MMIREFFAVGIGGAVGSMARCLLSGILLGGVRWFGFPAGTLVVNVAGSLLIGILLEALSSKELVWLAVVGFCGGFTTFSTFSADALRLLRSGDFGPAAAYVLLSVGAALLATAAGMRIGTILKN